MAAAGRDGSAARNALPRRVPNAQHRSFVARDQFLGEGLLEDRADRGLERAEARRRDDGLREHAGHPARVGMAREPRESLLDRGHARVQILVQQRQEDRLAVLEVAIDVALGDPRAKGHGVQAHAVEPFGDEQGGRGVEDGLRPLGLLVRLAGPLK
jgi:hypothetical protein